MINSAMTDILVFCIALACVMGMWFAHSEVALLAFCCCFYYYIYKLINNEEDE